MLAAAHFLLMAWAVLSASVAIYMMTKITFRVDYWTASLNYSDYDSNLPAKANRK